MSRLGKGDANQAVTRHYLGEVRLTPAIGAFGPHRKHHEPMLGIGVLDADLDVFGKVEAEFRKNVPWPAHDAAPVVRRSVPLGRLTQDRTRVAGTQTAADHVMQRGCVLKYMQRRWRLDQLAGSTPVGQVLTPRRRTGIPAAVFRLACWRSSQRAKRFRPK